eukprot:2900699-Pyramimonas_sp.AAC.2
METRRGEEDTEEEERNEQEGARDSGNPSAEQAGPFSLLSSWLAPGQARSKFSARLDDVLCRGRLCSSRCALLTFRSGLESKNAAALHCLRKHRATMAWCLPTPVGSVGNVWRTQHALFRVGLIAVAPAGCTSGSLVERDRRQRTDPWDPTQRDRRQRYDPRGQARLQTCIAVATAGCAAGSLVERDRRQRGDPWKPTRLQAFITVVTFANVCKRLQTFAN